MNDHLTNLRLSGASETNGGLFDEVILSGGSRVRGDLECRNFHASGSSQLSGRLICHEAAHASGASHFQGDVQAGELHLSGDSHCFGEVYCDGDLHLSGASHIERSATCQSLIASGASHIGGNLCGHLLKASGATQIDGAIHMNRVELSGASCLRGDVECEAFKGSGSINIGGLLNADSVEITLSDRAKCTLQDVGGDRVRIVLDTSSKSSLSGTLRKWLSGDSNSSLLTARTIEATDIYLENCTIQTVRGARIAIGSNCRIGQIEYSESLSADDSSKILHPPVKL